MHGAVLVLSTHWPGWLEPTEDVEWGSPSFAAALLVGAPRNGWEGWRTVDGAPLSTCMSGVRAGPNRPWLVRGSNVPGLDPVQRLWLLERRVTLATPASARASSRQGTSKEHLRALVEEEYESTAHTARNSSSSKTCTPQR